MRTFLLFTLLFSATLILTAVNYKSEASIGYSGVFVGETQDFQDPGKPGYVKAYTAWYCWWAGCYGWTGADYVRVDIRQRAAGKVVYSSSSRTCGNQWNSSFNCTGPGSDVWVPLPGTGQWVTTEHEYDNCTGDSNWVEFYSAYSNPTAATKYYFQDA